VSSAFKTEYALDASALLAVMLNEPGSEGVRAIIGRAFVHSVNVAEVVGKLVKEGVPREEVEEMIQEIGLDMARELSTAEAALCGELLAKTTRQGLSLGDCICLTVAACMSAIAVTADRQWKELDGERVGSCQIRVLAIR
jgi:ribonuclease VapC